MMTKLTKSNDGDPFHGALRRYRFGRQIEAKIITRLKAEDSVMTCMQEAGTSLESPANPDFVCWSSVP